MGTATIAERSTLYTTSPATREAIGRSPSGVAIGVSGDAHRQGLEHVPSVAHSQHAFPSGPLGTSHASPLGGTQVPGAQLHEAGGRMHGVPAGWHVHPVPPPQQTSPGAHVSAPQCVPLPASGQAIPAHMGVGRHTAVSTVHPQQIVPPAHTDGSRRQSRPPSVPVIPSGRAPSEPPPSEPPPSARLPSARLPSITTNPSGRGPPSDGPPSPAGRSSPPQPTETTIAAIQAAVINWRMGSSPLVRVHAEGRHQ